LRETENPNIKKFSGGIFRQDISIDSFRTNYSTGKKKGGGKKESPGLSVTNKMREVGE